MAKTRLPDSAKRARQEALRNFCKAKGWQAENGDWRLQEIATFFGKASNKMSDLLYGRGSFGPQIARDLEAASKNELLPYELDGAAFSRQGDSMWPFSQELLKRVASLDAEDRWHAENLLRHHLKMSQLPELPSGGERPAQAA